jgi:hypothetical protein
VTQLSEHYPLATLEGVRRRLLDAARAELAASAAQSDAARERAREAEGRLGEALLARREAEGLLMGPGGADLELRGRWLARLVGIERLLRDEAERRGEVAAKVAREEDACRRWVVDAERQLRAVELHRGRWEQTRRRALEAAEERDLEDRASAPGRRGGYFPAP